MDGADEVIFEYEIRAVNFDYPIFLAFRYEEVVLGNDASSCAKIHDGISDQKRKAVWPRGDSFFK